MLGFNTILNWSKEFWSHLFAPVDPELQDEAEETQFPDLDKLIIRLFEMRILKLTSS